MVRGKRVVRAILLDGNGRLLLIKRTKPGLDLYWTAAGGGVDDTDVSLEAALRRELSEELGAQAAIVSRVYMIRSATVVQHFLTARLTKLDEAARHGPEFDDPSRGSYELDRMNLCGNDLASVNLKPDALKGFILANRNALVAEVERSMFLTSGKPRISSEGSAHLPPP